MEGKTQSILNEDRRLAHLAHELRTPLTAIIGYAEAMRLRAFGPLDDRYADCAEIIGEAGRHMLALADDLLAPAPIDASERPNVEAFDAAEAVAWTLRLMAREAQAANVILRFAPTASPPQTSFDRRALVQILVNLIANAIRHTPAGGVVAVALEAEEADTAALTVSDSGPGFAPGSQTAGVGLGLVRHLVEAGGGTMSLAGGPNSGAVVTIRLPIAAGP